jgi:hypothetical protein
VFVLYLRAFDEDAAIDEPEPLTPMIGTDFTPMAPMYALLALSRSAEEHLVACVRDVGPVIAVGRPGPQKLPPAGAPQLYLHEDDWQGQVLDLMTRARLVVLILEPTDWTLWEFVEAICTVPYERLLLVMPESKVKYEQFRQRATILLSKRAADIHRRTGERWTPPELPHNAPTGSKWFSGFLSYTADRAPQVTSIRPSLIRAGVARLLDYGPAGIGPALRRAARPALDRLLAFEDVILKRDHPKLFERRQYYRDRRKMATAFLVVGLVLLPFRIKQLAWDTGWDLARMSGVWWYRTLLATGSIAAGLLGRYIYRRLMGRLAPPA